MLVVEDDVEISEPLVRSLRRDGNEVTLVAEGLGAVDAALGGGVDLVVLDLGLPDIDGMEVCRRIRVGRPLLPVLMLTARGEEIDAIAGLDAGADDYIAKPFRVAELLARIRTHLRRSTPRRLCALGVEVLVDQRRVLLDGAEIALKPKEYDLLVLLLGEAGSVLTRERIMAEVWGEAWYPNTKTLDVHISWLRARLGENEDRRFITTVRGVGYRFEPGAEQGG